MTPALLLLGLALAQEPEPPSEPVPVPVPVPVPDPAPAPIPTPVPATAPAPAPVDPRDADIFGPAPSSDPRDADIFGAPAPAPDDSHDDTVFGPPTSDSPPEVAAGLEGPTRSDKDILERLGLADARVTLGGFAYLRLDGTYAEGDTASTAGLGSPSLLDLFVDVRPNDRIRFYVRGRLHHDITIRSGDFDAFGNPKVPTTVALDQLWLNFDVKKRVFLTVGKQRIKWGVGRIWNPTDFLAPSALNPLDVFDERLGVGLIKVHIPFSKTNTNVYVIGEFQDVRHPEDIGGALRVEQLLGPVEVAVSAAAQKDQPQDLGAQISFPLWLFDVKGEVAVLHGVQAPGWEGDLDFETGEVPTEVDRSDDWIPQVLGGLELGLKYSDEDSIYLGVEYFYNAAGTADTDIYPWLLAQQQYVPFYLGIHYIAGYVLLPGLGRHDDHSVTLTAISNLSDQTVIGRFDWGVRVLTELSFNAYTQVHGGPAGGEFAFALEVPPIPGVFDDGLQIPKPIVDLGVGLQVRF